jgi:purine-nucleoside phosphorylase
VTTENAFELAQQAAGDLLRRCGVEHFDLAIVLGSGWKQAADALGTPGASVLTREIRGFVAPTVPGHDGIISAIRIGDRNVALISGRVHLYEGHSVTAVVHPIRTAIFAGATKVLLTNAAGSIDRSVKPGSIVVVRDHLNLTATSPLEGDGPPDPYASRFVDLTHLYDPGARARIKVAFPEMSEGVYAGVRGPHYETPAEIDMLRTMGASLVGMSTVLEAIAARHLGAQVSALSLVTNLAAGVSPTPLHHLEVLEAGKNAQGELATVMSTLVPLL